MSMLSQISRNDRWKRFRAFNIRGNSLNLHELCTRPLFEVDLHVAKVILYRSLYYCVTEHCILLSTAEG